MDGRPVRHVTVTGTRPLAAVLTEAPATWLGVIATSSDGRTLELARPATAYPDAEVRLYLDHDRAALGVFRTITPDMPPEIAAIARQPVVALAGIVTITVHTHERVLPPLTIRVDGREQRIEEPLHALQLRPTRKARERGWPIGSVVALAVPTNAVRTIQLHPRKGAPMRVDPQVLQDPDAILKQNQRDQYVFRMWDNDGNPVLELRDVTWIEIERAPTR